MKPNLDATRRASIRAGVWVLAGFLIITLTAIVGARIHTARAGFTIDIAFSFLSNLTRNAKVLLAGGEAYAHDLAEPRGIKAPGDEAEPGEIERQEDHQRDEIGVEEFHRTLRSFEQKRTGELGGFAQTGGRSPRAQPS